MKKIKFQPVIFLVALSQVASTQPSDSALTEIPTPQPNDPHTAVSNYQPPSTPAENSAPLPDLTLEPGTPAQIPKFLATKEIPLPSAKTLMMNFEDSLEELIKKQRNPNVPDLTLADAIQLALRQNPAILNAIQQIRLTRGQAIQIRARALPQILINSSYNQIAEDLNPASRAANSSLSRLIVPNPLGGPPTILELQSPQIDVQNQTWNIQFVGNQLIFDGGATLSAIRAGNLAQDAAFYSLRATIDSIISQVISSFYAVVLNRALIVAQMQNVRLLEEQVRDQKNRFEAGTVPRFNVLQAEVQLANARPPLIQAENAYRISLYQLVQLLGVDYPTGKPSEVPFNVVGKLNYEPKNFNPDESIRVAIARNPGLKAQRQNILSLAANLQAQIGNFFPVINATAGYRIENDTQSSNLRDTLTGWFFGATGTWNIWDSGQTYGQVAQAKAQLMQAKNSYDDAVRRVVLEVQQAISNLTEAKETIESLTASVVQAIEALRLSRERLDAGVGTQLDVLNTQVQLLQAQTNVLQARYLYIQAMAEFNRALSLDTQYEETFDDPLIRPLTPQTLTKSESRRFDKLNDPNRKQPKLPTKFRGQDPIAPILEKSLAPKPTQKPKTKAKTPAQKIK